MRKSVDITELLNAAQAGDADAAGLAYAHVYDELKRCARNSLRRSVQGPTLNPTGLVHEAYLRLCDRPGKPVRDRVHFFALAARAMRQILVDHARRRQSSKRGGRHVHTELDAVLDDRDDARTLELDVALRQLEARDAALARLVEWHFFGGLGFAEIAAETGRHERTVRRDWELARAFLKRAVDGHSP